MNKVLCATDLSENSRPVLMVAAGLAQRLKGELELLHVIDLPPVLPPRYLQDGVVVDIQAQATALVEQRAVELRRSGLVVRVCVRLDSVTAGIAKRARETAATLVVIGTHSRKGAARVFLGSVAERTVREAPCPVMVVPPDAHGHLMEADHPHHPLRILGGVDSTAASDAALEWLRTFTQQTSCDLHLVHLYWPVREHERMGVVPSDDFESDPEVLDSLARELKAHIGAHLGRTDVPLALRALWGAEEDPLVWEADADQADLIVVGTDQRRRSTAVATLRASRVPVLCVPGRRTHSSSPPLKAVRTVLATTDLSPLGNAAVTHAYQLLLAGGGTVILVHIADSSPVDLDPDRQGELETALLALVPSAAARHRIRTRTVVTAEHSPGDAIVKIIRRLGPEVVVMASHGRTAIGWAIHGSVTNQVLRTSPRPVLVIPREPREPHEE